MKPRELIPFLVAAQALNLVLLIIVVLVLVSWKRSLVAAVTSRRDRAHPTMPLGRNGT